MPGQLDSVGGEMTEKEVDALAAEASSAFVVEDSGLRKALMPGSGTDGVERNFDPDRGFTRSPIVEITGEPLANPGSDTDEMAKFLAAMNADIERTGSPLPKYTIDDLDRLSPTKKKPTPPSAPSKVVMVTETSDTVDEGPTEKVREKKAPPSSVTPKPIAPKAAAVDAALGSEPIVPQDQRDNPSMLPSLSTVWAQMKTGLSTYSNGLSSSFAQLSNRFSKTIRPATPRPRTSFLKYMKNWRTLAGGASVLGLGLYSMSGSKTNTTDNSSNPVAAAADTGEVDTGSNATTDENGGESANAVADVATTASDSSSKAGTPVGHSTGKTTANSKQVRAYDAVVSAVNSDLSLTPDQAHLATWEANRTLVDTHGNSDNVNCNIPASNAHKKMLGWGRPGKLSGWEGTLDFIDSQNLSADASACDVAEVIRTNFPADSDGRADLAKRYLNEISYLDGYAANDQIQTTQVAGAISAAPTVVDSSIQQAKNGEIENWEGDISREKDSSEVTLSRDKSGTLVVECGDLDEKECIQAVETKKSGMKKKSALLNDDDGGSDNSSTDEKVNPFDCWDETDCPEPAFMRNTAAKPIPVEEPAQPTPAVSVLASTMGVDITDCPEAPCVATPVEVYEELDFDDVISPLCDDPTACPDVNFATPVVAEWIEEAEETISEATAVLVEWVDDKVESVTRAVIPDERPPSVLTKVTPKKTSEGWFSRAKKAVSSVASTVTTGVTKVAKKVWWKLG